MEHVGGVMRRVIYHHTCNVFYVMEKLSLERCRKDFREVKPLL